MQLLGNQKEGVEARTANRSQVRIDKHELAALNLHKLKVSSSKFWQRNYGVSLYHLAPMVFKVLMHQLNIFIRKQTSVAWPEELCRRIPERSSAHAVRNRSSLAHVCCSFTPCITRSPAPSSQLRAKSRQWARFTTAFLYFYLRIIPFKSEDRLD